MYVDTILTPRLLLWDFYNNNIIIATKIRIIWFSDLKLSVSCPAPPTQREKGSGGKGCTSVFPRLESYVANQIAAA